MIRSKTLPNAAMIAASRAPNPGVWLGFLCLALMVLTACTSTPAVDSAATPPTTAPAQVAGKPAEGQATFTSDDEASAKLLETLKARDKDALHRIFGPAWKDMVSPDQVQAAHGFDNFVARATEQMHVEKKADNLSILHIGTSDWPFPIPLVKTASGQWFFDTAAGKEEILARRIGADELAAIKVCRAYVAAQREYAGKERDGSDVLEYAQHLISSPGKHDGLYWAAAGNEEQSPFGPLAAEAALEGYAMEKGGLPRAFHGYRLRILKAQGPAAPAGQYNYVINGHMIAGFGLVACPAQYRVTGVMTFIVNHQGKVYQKDLGPNTLEIVKAMKEYNPDKSWTLVTP